MTIILASSSPRRAELLNQVGIPFKIIEPSISESMQDNVPASEMVAKLALKKAFSVSVQVDSGYVLSADTAVISGSEIMGKPLNEKDAYRMLKQLSGTKHLVLSGLALVDVTTGGYENGFAETHVWLKTLLDEQIYNYIATGEPIDKAGAYGVQGRAALFVDKIEGCYSNVVGLPLGLLFDFFKRLQIPTWFNRKGWRE
ncbi:MAG: Maf family protein [Bacillota bacterium]